MPARTTGGDRRGIDTGELRGGVLAVLCQMAQWQRWCLGVRCSGWGPRCAVLGP